MNTKNRLNCYVFSNLIISILSLNFLIQDDSYTIQAISNSNSSFIVQTASTIPVATTSISNVNLDLETTTITISKKSVQSQNVINYVKPSYNSITGSNLVNYAKHYLGLQYVHGGNSLTTGTDCSGFTKLIYQEFGISLGRTVNSQLYSGKYVSKSDLQPGDLVFYGYSNYATHVAIYMGNGLVIHQSNPSDGVKINSVNMMVYITARRIITADVTSSNQDTSESEELPSVSEDNTLNDSNQKEENADLQTDEKKENVDNDSTSTDEIKDEVKEESNQENIEEENNNNITNTNTNQNTDISNSNNSNTNNSNTNTNTNDNTTNEVVE